MSVTTYEIECNYKHSKLKNKIYFISNNNASISIDNGAASVSMTGGITPNVIEGFGIKFTETESLDERYKFTKQLNISINGHLTDAAWLLENDFYLIVETIEGIFYLINVDFPSKMNFTYNLSNSQDQTDFVFTSNSNFPALKVNSVPWNGFNTCKTYHVPGVDYLKLLEKDYATIDKENGVVNLFDSHVFKNIDYFKNTISLSESYDGDIATTTISFEIPFDDYKTSWQYNLLEFKQNLYVAEVGNANGNGIFVGFEHGLEPSYEINGSTSESEPTSIKITLTEASNWGIFEFDNWSYNNVTTKKWVGVQSEYICLSLGVAGYTLMMETDENGTPTGRYMCLSSEIDRYSQNYNIIGTYSEPERFRSSKCSRSMTRGGTITDYTCIDGNKYEIIAETISYDNGKTYTQTEFSLGPMVESGSTWCLPPPDYKWELDENEFGCLYEMYDRWTESASTCDGYDKHTFYYKELSFDRGNTWVKTEPLETKEVISNCSDDCIDYYSKQYLTFEALEDCYFSLNIGTLLHHQISDFSLSYSVDGGDTWRELLFSTATVPSGGTVIFAGHWPSSWEDYATFNSTGRFNAYGNINSLVYGHNFICTYADDAPLPYLFVNTDIVSAENLIFPESKNGLKVNHYYYMFSGCASLTTPPKKLPAKNFNGESVYYGMFAGCTSLTSAPELPATLGKTYRCYREMFSGCTSLTTPPELPSLVVNDEDYFGMFAGCTSLTTAPDLPATTFGSNGYGGYRCYYRMFEGCTSLTTAPYLPATTIDTNCYESMFAGCTSLTTVPELPATTLYPGCYEVMFAGCTSLTTVPSNMLPATTMLYTCRPTGGTCYANSCYKYMFSGCTSLTTVPELPATELAAKCYESMFAGCTSLTTAPDLPVTNLSGASSAYTSMFAGCTSLTTAPELPATTLASYCYSQMFYGCISLTSSPELPAATLSTGCYESMFEGCTNLSYITCLATYISPTDCTKNWVYNVASSGVFKKASSMSSWTRGVNGIPTNWTVIDNT